MAASLRKHLRKEKYKKVENLAKYCEGVLLRKFVGISLTAALLINESLQCFFSMLFADCIGTTILRVIISGYFRKQFIEKIK